MESSGAQTYTQRAEAAPSWLHHLFLRHPEAVGESYVEHARVAARFGLAMIAGGMRCLVHAAVPGVQQRAASDTVRALHRQLEQRRAESETDPDYVI